MRKAVLYLHPSLLMLSAMATLLAVGALRGFAQSNDLASLKKDQHHQQHYEEIAKVPEKARAKSNPLAEDPDATRAGRKLFEQHCAECHGNTAHGGRRAPSLRAEEVQQATPGTLFWILTNGVVRRGMPVWSKLPEPQRWQIVTYLKSLGIPEKAHAEEEKPIKDQHTQPRSLAPGTGQKP
jgi:mono/diheme cytochrome c family protein